MVKRISFHGWYSEDTIWKMLTMRACGRSRDQEKGETLGPVLKVYENRDVGNADVNCYCRSNKVWNNFHTPIPDNSLVLFLVN